MSNVSRWYGICARRAALRIGEEVLTYLGCAFLLGAFIGGVAAGFKVVCHFAGVE
ncbi:hypothetical protein [Dyella jiangningensis]|uniref:hypothetical protein n=1 Tax=Dyella jiangningensis TaxID=1379159 RepID=UPI001559D935|nr:hypothetical protein [Dyella jiangningensis]